MKVVTKRNGNFNFTIKKGDKFIWVLYDRRGKRYRRELDNYSYALGINVFKGNLYLVRDGKRHLIKKVFNF